MYPFVELTDPQGDALYLRADLIQRIEVGDDRETFVVMSTRDKDNEWEEFECKETPLVVSEKLMDAVRWYGKVYGDPDADTAWHS